MNRIVRLYNAATDRENCLVVFDSNTPLFFDATERDDFAAFLDRQREHYFVVEDANGVVGCGGWGWKEPRIAILCWGMIYRGRQREGLGTLLLTHRLAAIRKRAFDAVEVWTSQHSATFFLRAGFETLEVQPSFFARGLDGHRMVLTVE